MTEISVHRTFQVPIAKVWSALTDPEAMRKWYFHIPDFTLEQGAVFTFYEKEEGGSFLHRCEVVKVEPERLLEYSWEHPSHSKGKSWVTWELNSLNDGATELRLTHRGVENFKDAGPEFAPDSYQAGWEGFIGTSLKMYLYGFERLRWEIEISTARERVWEVLWDQETYGKWTAVFDNDSRLQGELKAGSRVHFLSGGGDGMFSNVVMCVPHKSVAFSHMGVVENGVELPVTKETEEWSGCMEIYWLKQTQTGTLLKVEMDCDPGHISRMQEVFPKALQIVKQLSEITNNHGS